MRMLWLFAFLFCIIFSAINKLQAQTLVPSYKILNNISISGSDSGSRIFYDTLFERLLIIRNQRIQIVNRSTGTQVAEMPDSLGASDLTICYELKKGFISNSKDNSITVFSLDNLKILQKIRIRGINPTHILYDPQSKKVFVLNATSKSVSILDPIFETVLAEIPLKGIPSAIVSNYKGRVYITLSDKDQLVVMETRKYVIKERFNIYPGETPTAFAIDTVYNRVFIACDKRTMVVMSPAKGKIIGTISIGEKCSSVVFNPYSKAIFATDDSGMLTIISQFNGSRYKLAQRMDIVNGNAPIALDSKNNQLYIFRFASPSDATGINSSSIITIGVAP